jgi:hypothetical protein
VLDPAPLDPFCVAELPAQIIRSDALLELVAQAGGWTNVQNGLVRAAQAQVDVFAWETVLAWYRALAALSQACDAEN